MVRIISALVLVSSFISYAHADQSLNRLRNNYQQWIEQYPNADDDERKKMLNELKSYPLYSYAKYQYLKDNIKSLSTTDAAQFIQDYPDFALSVDFQRSYIKELFNRQDYQHLVTFPIDDSTASRCQYLYAKWKLNPSNKTLASVQSIWLTGKELPSACDPLLSIWQQADLKSADLILRRTKMALSENNLKLARIIAEQLPDSYKTVRKNLLAVISDYQEVSGFSQAIKPSGFTRDIVMTMFPRWARQAPQDAQNALAMIAKQQNFSPVQVQKLKESIAWQYFSSAATASQLKWRDEVIANSKNTSLIEHRIRQALRDNDDKALASWLGKLPKEVQQNDEWRYWSAQLLIKNNKPTEAKAILAELSKNRGFYPMLSAQLLGTKYLFNYSFVKDSIPVTEQMLLKSRYDNDASIERVRELRYWNMLQEASREWRNLLYQKGSTKQQQEELARYAYLNQWGEHSVQATIAGKLWSNWLERFPIVHQDEFYAAIKDKDISLSYALAISRQESALEPMVQSPAGARGLMQLMPSTAKDSANKLQNSDYVSSDQLYDPVMNIQLGTYYLNYVYTRFDNNRVLASAAYNAGPSRVARWLEETKGKLSTAAFIESIPFAETRNYVKTVLVYDYIYHVILGQKINGILTKEEFARLY